MRLCEGSNLGIRHLCLSKLKFSVAEAENFTAYLSSTSSIITLSLVYCKFKPRQALVCVSQGVEACRCLQQLNLLFSPYFETYYDCMFEMLQRNSSLKKLHVTCDLYGACKLADALCGNCTLRVLVIEGDSLDYELERNDVAIAVAKMLRKNTVLVDFNLANIDLSTKDISILVEGLHGNSTLERLNISHSYIEVEGSESLAEMLNQNRTLEHLNLSSCCLVKNGASVIAEALCNNTSVKTLSISVDSIGVNGARAFASVLEQNTTLKELLISDVFSFLHKTADEWVNEFIILSNALHQNTTLEKLKIIPPSYFQAEAIIEQVTTIEYAKDNRISTL